MSIRPLSKRRPLGFEALESRWVMAAPTLSIADMAVVEGHSGKKQAVFSVTLSAPSKQIVRVRYATAAGSAQSTDFQSASGTLMILPGQRKATFPVWIKGDKTVEPDETFTVRLSQPSGATLAKASGVGTIRTDDFPPPTATVASIVAAEEAGIAQFNVRVNHAGPSPVIVRYETKPGTAAQADFTATKGTLTFGPDEFEKTVSVNLVNDAVVELDEQFSLVVSLGATTGPLLATGAATIQDTDEVAPPAGPRLIGYFPSWRTYDRDYQVMDVPAEQLTHLIYAFAGISAEGTIEVGDKYADVDRLYDNEPRDPPGPIVNLIHGNFRQLQLLKQEHPHLKTMLSVGGWLGSARFSDVAATVQARTKFVGSVVKLLEAYGFDGVDIDWEFPVSGGLPTNRTRPQDRHNFTLLAQEFRKQFDAREAATGKHMLLTIALGTQPEQYANYELRDLPRFADWVHMMTYDYHGTSSEVTGHNGPLYANPDDPETDPVKRLQFNIDAGVDAFLDAGVLPGKLVVGAAFYGVGWSNVPADNDGLFQPVGGVPEGTWEDAGSFEYYDIKNRLLPQMDRHWDDASKVPWLYDPASGLMISYDDPESLGHKARYVRDRGLGGMLAWELSGDDEQHSLIEAIADNLQ
jgi:chitinase